MNLEGVRKIGKPAYFAEKYDKEGIDEIYYNDAVASLYGRNSILEFVQSAADETRVPITIGGGLRSIQSVREAFLAGADSVAINTAAVQRPELISELSQKFGSQAITLQVDAKRKNGGWEAYIDGGREPTGLDAVAWAERGQVLGAGQVLVTSVDNEGTYRGVDVALIQRLSEDLSVPLVYSGGVGKVRDVVDAAQAGASGVAMAGVLHYNKLSLSEIRGGLIESGIKVRL